MRMKFFALALVACLAGCAVGARPEAPVYSNASVSGKYRLSSTAKPFVNYGGGGPTIGEGEVAFDGHGNLAGSETFLGVPATIHGTYQIERDGSGTASMITTLNDGVSYKGALSLQIKDDGQVQFVSKGLPQNDDWVSGEELMAEGQAGLQGVFEKE
jgi:hypothetical protein